MDITSSESIRGGISGILENGQSVDIWVNNAYPRTDDWGLRFEDIPPDSLKANIEMHMGGYFLCCRVVCEVMKKQQCGSVINMASIYGIVGPDFSIYEGTSMTMPAAYSLIKGGIISFSRYLASYYGSSNVRVNWISPGGVEDDQDQRFIENYSAKLPLGRLAAPYEISTAVVFLASDASSYITGHNLVVDGGWSAV